MPFFFDSSYPLSPVALSLSLYQPVTTVPFVETSDARVSLFSGYGPWNEREPWWCSRAYIFIYSFFAKEQGGLSAPGAHPPKTVKCVPEASVGNRCFRRRAELDRRACTRSCSSDTDSRCRLHWSRLTGRDYYKGGWRDVRIYSGQGMRRTCMLLYNPASQPAREILFNSTSPFFSSARSAAHLPPSPSPFPFLPPVLQNRSSFDPDRLHDAEIPLAARNAMQQPFNRYLSC